MCKASQVSRAALSRARDQQLDSTGSWSVGSVVDLGTERGVRNLLSVAADRVKGALQLLINRYG